MFVISIKESHYQQISIGLWLLFGFFTFLSIEKLFPDSDNNCDNDNESEIISTNHSNDYFSKGKKKNARKYKRKETNQPKSNEIENFKLPIYKKKLRFLDSIKVCFKKS